MVNANKVKLIQQGGRVGEPFGNLYNEPCGEPFRNLLP